MKDNLDSMLPAPREEARTVRRIDKLLDPVAFEHMQRVGNLLAASPMFPVHLRPQGDKTAALANAVLVLNLADRLGEDVMAVAQSVYFVGGKPGWSAPYVIGKANQSGVFKGRIRWRVEGEGDSLKVTAYATLADTGEEVSDYASMEMAKAEGWTKNPKYRSMPERMLRYRSAVFLVRTVCPEVLMGMGIQEELEDVRAAEARDVTPPEAQERAAEPEKAKPAPAARKEPDPVEDAEVVDEKEKAAPKAEEKPKDDPAPKAEDDPGPEPKAVERDADGLPTNIPADWKGPVSAFAYQLDSVTSLEEVEQVAAMYEDDLAAAKDGCKEAHGAMIALLAEARKKHGGKG